MKRPYHGWVLAVTFGFCETVSWGVLYYAFSVLIAPTTAELGWSRAQISGALSVMLVVSGLAGLAVGRWLDDHGPRLLMTAGSIAAVPLVIAWSQVRDLASFYVIWVFIGVAFATVNYGPAFATMIVWFRRDRSRALTLVTLFAGFASTVFVPLTAWLVSVQGWRQALVTLAVLLAVLTIAPYGLLLRRRPADLGLGVDGDPPDGHPDAPPVTPELSHSFREALRHPTFKWLALAFSLYALGVGVPVHLVAYLGDHGYPLAFAAAATGGIGAAQVLGRLLFAPLERRLAPRTVSLLVYAGQPLALLVLLFATSEVGVIAFVLLFGAARGAETLVRSTIVAGLYGPRRIASIAAVLTLATTLTQAISPVSLGAVYDTVGNYIPGFWALFALSCVAMVAVYLGDRRPARG
ncbi:MAG TPA: MFS transporter [Candidatus Limnocylindria bacterium]|nr:MFS transporter [Candidatus Limnocylindria bacterium]